MPTEIARTKPTPNWRAACDGTEAQGAASGNDAGERSAAGVGRSENAADARACDRGDRNLVLLEDLQYAEMSEAASEATTQGEADSCPQGGCAWPGAQCGFVELRHANRVSSLFFRAYGPGVLKKQYGCTAMERCVNSC